MYLRHSTVRKNGKSHTHWRRVRSVRHVSQVRQETVAHLGSSPRTVVQELRAIASGDVVLPLDDGRELKLRCVVRPDEAQAALLDRLGLELPRRLRQPLPAEM